MPSEHQQVNESETLTFCLVFTNTVGTVSLTVSTVGSENTIGIYMYIIIVDAVSILGCGKITF